MSLPPESASRSRRTHAPLSWASAAVFAAAYAFYALPLPWPANSFDDGISCVAARRICAGEIPYADFMILHTPGSYLLLAGVFRAFGDSFDVYSGLNHLLLAGQVWVIWHVARRLGAGLLTSMIALLAGLAFAYPYPSVALALGTVLFAARPDIVPSPRTAVTAGALAALTALFRQDFGLTAALGAGAALWVRTEVPTRRRLALVVICGASSAVFLGLLLSPALVRDPGAVWEQLFVNPRATIPFRAHAGWGETLSSLTPAQALLAAMLAAVVAFGIAALFVPRRAASVLDDPRVLPLAAGVALLAAWSLRYWFVRPDHHHFVAAGLLAGVVSGFTFRRTTSRSRLGVVWAALALATILPWFYEHAGARVRDALGRRPSRLTTMDAWVAGTSSLYLPPGEASNYAALIERLGVLTAPDEPIFSGSTRHDYVHDQDLLLYYLSRRRSAIHDDHFDPGVTTREDVQRRIAADIDRIGIRVVVRRNANTAVPPGTPLGSTYLDEFLAQTFQRSETIGRYEIWLRR